MITAYLFNNDGKPIMERQYYAPGRFYIDQAISLLGNEIVESEIVRLHMGFGSFQEFKVEAVDGRTALIVAVD